MSTRTRRCTIAILAGGAFLLATLVGAGPAEALNPNHDCAFCHSLHSAPGQNLLAQPTAENVCMSCHGPAGISTLKAEVHTNKQNSNYAPFAMTCIRCHDPHDSEQNEVATTNLLMIGRDLDGTGIAKINTPNSGLRSVVFTSRGTDAGGPAQYSFADGDATYNGICETCHTQTLNHQNGTVLPDTSNHGHGPNGVTCTVCHPHDDSFRGSGGECRNCHNAPQNNGDGQPTWQTGRREVLSEFSRASHHINWSTQVESADCLACHIHDGGTHMQGRVRLRDPDLATPTFLVQLDNDPVLSATEAAKLTAFCLKCHDSNGAAGSTGGIPFTDGQTPPNVAGTWANASHNTVGTLSCFGDGTTGCHGSGHGSLKRKLLALADLAPTAPANAEEEEGFCFVCHDSDGPSTKNVKAGFDTATNWADDTTQFGVTMNDRHDVKYADAVLSGAKIECTNCHNPHAANSSNRPMSLLKADPDPTDGRVPGTNWFGTLSGQSTDAISEWCMDCHDGSFPTGVNGPTLTGTLRNILLGDGGTSWVTSAHGAANGNAALKSGANYWTGSSVVSCRACHQPHPDNTPQPVTPSKFNNLFQMRQSTVGTDLTTTPPADDGRNLSYELTTLTARRDDTVSGYYLCNTCHTGSMGSGKSNCFDCHGHSDPNF